MTIGSACKVRLLQGAPPLKFAIFFAGALIRDRNLSYIYKEKVTLPSVHIIGDKDYVKEVIQDGPDAYAQHVRLPKYHQALLVLSKLR